MTLVASLLIFGFFGGLLIWFIGKTRQAREETPTCSQCGRPIYYSSEMQCPDCDAELNIPKAGRVSGGKTLRAIGLAVAVYCFLVLFAPCGIWLIGYEPYPMEKIEERQRQRELKPTQPTAPDETETRPDDPQNNPHDEALNEQG